MSKQEPIVEGSPVSEQDWSGVAKSGIAGMTPADKGWILGFVVIFALFQLSNYLISSEGKQQETIRSERIIAYFNRLEDSRLEIEKNRAQEVRRLQEMVKEMTQTVARESERQSRQRAQVETIEKAKQ